jgi:hypothetical protein
LEEAMYLNTTLAEHAGHKTVIVLDRSPAFAQPADKVYLWKIKGEIFLFGKEK